MCAPRPSAAKLASRPQLWFGLWSEHVNLLANVGVLDSVRHENHLSTHSTMPSHMPGPTWPNAA
ncbi:hypothetical protein CSX11_23090 [Mycobacterium goodii]|nr:hypothetical protein CSX11_23090 [Mycolicibacterium goodii]